MSEFKVALRYSRSLLEEAVDKKSEDTVKSDMQILLDTCNESRDLRIVLSNPIIHFDKKSSILTNIFKGILSDLSMRFLDLVCKKGRASILIQMAEEYLNQYNIFKNINKASLTTVFALDSKMRNEFVQILEKGFGKKVELEERIDSELIGGFVLQLNDRQIDESIRHRLNQLKLNLIDQSYNSLV